MALKIKKKNKCTCKRNKVGTIVLVCDFCYDKYVKELENGTKV